jgi:hypothetical protein
MTLIDLARELLGKVRDNADITTWSQAKYGKGLTLFLGYDQKASPETMASACPFVMIGEGQKESGLESQKTATLSLTWGISTPDVATTDGITELAGSRQSEELGDLIVAAISVVEAEYTVTEMELQPGFATSWSPFFPGEMTVNLVLR